MPNHVGAAKPGDLERAHPFPPGRFAETEPQSARGEVGSRDVGSAAGTVAAAGPRRSGEQRHTADEYTGVNPLPPIDPSMPNLKPGDQGG